MNAFWGKFCSIHCLCELDEIQSTVCFWSALLAELPGEKNTNNGKSKDKKKKKDHIKTKDSEVCIYYWFCYMFLFIAADVVLYI
jgi:hypothetical protein